MLYIIYYYSDGNEKNSLLANTTHGLNDRKIKQNKKTTTKNGTSKRKTECENAIDGFSKVIGRLISHGTKNTFSLV